ncbi:MAG: 1-acyl-sn-glycerol-3-phosphate acyltransferase [Candidatus Omnitrophota bacterium]
MTIVRTFFYWVCWVLFRCGYFCWLPMTVSGRENLPKGPFIFACNHLSYLDPTTVALAAIKRTSFVARDTLFRNPIFKAIISTGGAIPITRNSADIGAIKTIIKSLKQYPIVIFPEGTRHKQKRIKDIEAGIGLIAVKSKVPVVPVYLEGTDVAFGSGAKCIKPARLTIRFGKPVTYTKADGNFKEIANKIYTTIYELKQD